MAQEQQPELPFNLIPIEQARLRRDDGIERAVEHADAVKEAWSLDAFHLLEEYLRGNGEPFLAEHFVAWSAARIDQPPDARAWGGIFSRGRRRGLIERVGTANAVTSNLSPKPLWQRRNSPMVGVRSGEQEPKQNEEQHEADAAAAVVPPTRTHAIAAEAEEQNEHHEHDEH